MLNHFFRFMLSALLVCSAFSATGIAMEAIGRSRLRIALEAEKDFPSFEGGEDYFSSPRTSPRAPLRTTPGRYSTSHRSGKESIYQGLRKAKEALLRAEEAFYRATQDLNDATRQDYEGYKVLCDVAAEEKEEAEREVTRFQYRLKNLEQKEKYRNDSFPSKPRRRF